MSQEHKGAAIRWWAAIVIGTAAALLIAWLSHIAGVRLQTLLTIALGAVALTWLIVLVAAPWNLYFAARRVVAQIAVSRERGIVVPPAQEIEARRIARKMLGFALGGHVLSAAAAVVIGYLTGATIGYYIAGFYLFSAAIRPALAYFAHLRERIGSLSRESVHPREDVIWLRDQVNGIAGAVKGLRADLTETQRSLQADIRHIESRLADDIGHAQQVLSTDLVRVQELQAKDREAARSRDEDLGRRIDLVVRRIQDTLDGLTDHEELQAGLRALIRMIRADAQA
jgi:hypothetical protein